MCILQVATSVTRQTNRVVNVKHYVAADFHFQKLIAQRARHHLVGRLAASLLDGFFEFVEQPIDSDYLASARTHLAGC